MDITISDNPVQALCLEMPKRSTYGPFIPVPWDPDKVYTPGPIVLSYKDYVFTISSMKDCSGTWRGVISLNGSYVDSWTAAKDLNQLIKNFIRYIEDTLNYEHRRYINRPWH